MLINTTGMRIVTLSKNNSAGKIVYSKITNILDGKQQFINETKNEYDSNGRLTKSVSEETGSEEDEGPLEAYNFETII